MALLIRNGDIVTAGGRNRADIYVEDETITRIGSNLDAPPGAEIVVMDSFSTAEFARVVDQFAITSTVLPPAALTMLADDRALELDREAPVAARAGKGVAQLGIRQPATSSISESYLTA